MKISRRSPGFGQGGGQKISSQKEETRDEKDNVHLRETRYGAFQRSIRVPVAVDHEKIDATYKDGALRLTVPKSDAAKPRKIQIHG